MIDDTGWIDNTCARAGASRAVATCAAAARDALARATAASVNVAAATVRRSGMRTSRKRDDGSLGVPAGQAGCAPPRRPEPTAPATETYVRRRDLAVPSGGRSVSRLRVRPNGRGAGPGGPARAATGRPGRAAALLPAGCRGG